jgi:hypothetical protein
MRAYRDTVDRITPFVRFGADDTAPLHDPLTGHRLAERITLTERAGAAQFLAAHRDGAAAPSSSRRSTAGRWSIPVEFDLVAPARAGRRQQAKHGLAGLDEAEVHSFALVNELAGR